MTTPTLTASQIEALRIIGAQPRGACPGNSNHPAATPTAAGVVASAAARALARHGLAEQYGDRRHDGWFAITVAGAALLAELEVAR